MIINDVLKNKKGSTSILWVIICIIVVLSITAFLDITTKAWVLNELQGKMDISGKNTLIQMVEDEKFLREEIVAFDGDNLIDTTNGEVKISPSYQNMVWDKYIKELNKTVKIGESITSLIPQEIYMSFENTARGLGKSTKARPQIVLHSISKVRIKGSTDFDVYNQIAYTLYNADNNNDFQVTYSGTMSDGTIELIVRSNVRLVYR